MKSKLNPKVAAMALVLLTFLTAGGLAVKEVVAPGGSSGFTPDPDPPGGG